MSGYLGINFNPANIPKNKVTNNLKSVQGLISVIQTYACSRYGTQIVEMVKSIGDSMVEEFKDSTPRKLTDVRNETIQAINDIFDGKKKLGEKRMVEDNNSYDAAQVMTKKVINENELENDSTDITLDETTTEDMVYNEIDNFIAELTTDEKEQFKKVLIQLFTVILTNSSVRKKLPDEKKADTYTDVNMLIKNMYDVVYSICPNTNPNNIKVKGKAKFGKMSNTNCLLIGVAVLGILFYFYKNKKGGNLFGKRRRR
jgi:hypothetical protein